MPPSRVPDPSAPGPPRGGPWRKLFFVYELLVFIPILATTTLVMGVFATLLSLVSARAAFHCGTVWSWLLCKVAFVRVRVVGREHLRPGQAYVIMANHQSHFDVLAFYGHFGRQFRWVIKRELRAVPGLGWYCAAGGHVFVDRSSREAAIASLRDAGPRLRDQGVSVMVFPEGTRSPDGRLQPLKKGGFMMALDLGLPILPVTIRGTRDVLPARSWSLFPGRVEIRIHPPVPTEGRTERDRDALMAAVRKAIAFPTDAAPFGPVSGGP